LVANQSGQTVWRWDQQEPFGVNPANENPSGLGAFDLPLRLPGQYFDKETNLHYNYSRDYDPGIGRYVENDPIGLDGGLNTYAYAAGEPLSGFDPLGLEVRFICRYLSGAARITNYRHCFIHVTCPEESWIKTFSLFRDDVVGSLGYKAEDDPRDNPAAPSAPITFNQPVTPSQSCAAPCAYEKKPSWRSTGRSPAALCRTVYLDRIPIPSLVA
jgi:RHS repeat-associated protein